jgi:hypothetical protein
VFVKYRIGISVSELFSQFQNVELNCISSFYILTSITPIKLREHKRSYKVKQLARIKHDAETILPLKGQRRKPT